MTVPSKKLNVAPGNYLSSPNHFSLNCQKAEHFSKNLIKKKLNMVSCQYDQTIKNVDADKGS